MTSVSKEKMKMSVENVERIKKLSKEKRKEVYYDLLDEFVGNMPMIDYINALFTVAGGI